MSQTMRCLQVHEWGGALEPAEIPVPETGPTDVLVEVEATSVGLTVGNVMNGDLGDDEADLPRIPGHELVGRVVETGGGVTHVSEGDLVTAYFYLSCDGCEACLSGQQSLCENLGGFVSVDIDGGFAEYARLPAGNAIPLPDGIDVIAATAVPDAIGTPYHVANQRAKIRPDDDVLILGAGGGVGIHLVQMAQHFGGNVTAVDVVDEKLERCAELGAVHTINTADQPLSSAVDELGITYDAVVDFNGVVELLEDAASVLGPRGRLVNLTTFPGRTIDVSPREQVFGETEIVGSRYCSKYELMRSAELVVEGKIEPIVTEVVEMDDVQDLIDRIRAGEVVGRAAMTP
ncbi:MAG: alcohol dehydrogenase catalytic domain-containing protein [Halobacteriota archaeon]